MVDKYGENFKFFGFMLEEELAVGFLLAALGEHTPLTNKQNYYVVDEETSFKSLKEKFLKLYFRKDLAIILLSSQVEKKLASILCFATRILPIILVIPSRQQVEMRAHAYERRKTELLADVVAQFTNLTK